MDKIRVIDSETVRRLLSFDVLMPFVEKTLAAFSKGSTSSEGAVQPLRTRVNVHDKNGTLLVMPGYLPSLSALATKLVTMYPDNSSKGIHSHNAIVVLMKADTGEMEAILNGESITELRTAASSGVASKYLAPKQVKKVAVLGSGVQASSHARIHHYLFKPEKISVWSRTKSNAEALVAKLQSDGIKSAYVSPSVEEACFDADVINTCTLASSAILYSHHVKQGAHVNAVGAAHPDWRELDSVLMTSSVVYADSREAAEAEAGDVIHSKCKIFCEIGEVINVEKEARRNETTIYKNLGLAVLDAVSARLAYDLLEDEK